MPPSCCKRRPAHSMRFTYASISRNACSARPRQSAGSPASLPCVRRSICAEISCPRSCCSPRQPTSPSGPNRWSTSHSWGIPHSQRDASRTTRGWQVAPTLPSGCRSTSWSLAAVATRRAVRCPCSPYLTSLPHRTWSNSFRSTSPSSTSSSAARRDHSHAARSGFLCLLRGLRIYTINKHPFNPLLTLLNMLLEEKWVGVAW
jgi:hypothetical protein